MPAEHTLVRALGPLGPHHTAAAIGAPPAGNGGGGPPGIEPSGVPCVLNTILALLTVLAVMAAHAVYKLLRLPFRFLRGLFRHSPKPAPLTAR
ncbi:hypothetical protein GCM10007890_23950 [Methylobacterium tardum]|uniref:Uncharacterized protein n=1 Tax=Methylobacterium tardum TaxID=374432 RepID=A0AA37TI75_9HYPH|nr:hypothetical protein GCM10007890_23950 [Methylobacterium tardum]